MPVSFKDGDYVTNPFILQMRKPEKLGSLPGFFMLGYADSYVLIALTTGKTKIDFNLDINTNSVVVAIWSTG